MVKSKIYKSLLIISNIITIVAIILNFITQSKYTVGLYWASTLFIILFVILFLNEIDKGKIDYDLNKSKTIKQRFGEANFSILVLYGFIYMVVEFVRIINDDLSNSLYLICGYYVITFVFQIITFGNIYSTNQEINKILDNKSRKKK